MPSSACAKIISYGAPKNGTVTRLSRFFASLSCSSSCILRSSRAEAGTPLFFLPLPLPADNAIERLARRSSLTVHQKCGQAVRPAAFFASLSCSNSCILRSSRAEAGTRNDLSYAALFMLPSLRRALSKFSRGSFPRAAPAKGQPARRLSPHSPQDRYPASDRSRPALRSAPR